MKQAHAGSLPELIRQVPCDWGSFLKSDTVQVNMFETKLFGLRQLSAPYRWQPELSLMVELSNANRAISIG